MKSAASLPSPTWASAVPGQAPLRAQPAPNVRPPHTAPIRQGLAPSSIGRPVRVRLPLRRRSQRPTAAVAIAEPITPTTWKSVNRNMPAMVS